MKAIRTFFVFFVFLHSFSVLGYLPLKILDQCKRIDFDVKPNEFTVIDYIFAEGNCWYFELKLNPKYTYAFSDYIKGNSPKCRGERVLELIIFYPDESAEYVPKKFEYFDTFTLIRKEVSKATVLLEANLAKRQKCRIKSWGIYLDVFTTLEPKSKEKLERKLQGFAGTESIINRITFDIIDETFHVFTTEFVDKLSDVTEFVFEGPENSSLAFYFSPVRSVPHFYRKFDMDLGSSKLKIVFAEEETKLWETEIETNQKFEDHLTKNVGNKMAASFNSKDAILFGQYSYLFSAVIIPLRTPLDCILFVEDCGWQRGDPSSPNTFLLSPWIQTNDPLCLNMHYNFISNSKLDTFFVLWETRNTTEVLFFVYWINTTDSAELLSVTVPPNSFGRIRTLLVKKEETSEVTVYVTSTKKEPCSNDCMPMSVNNYLCDWEPIPKGKAAFDLPVAYDHLGLKSNGQIVSPKMETGYHCFDMKVSGSGRLSISLLEGAKRSFLQSYIIDTSHVQSRRVILKVEKHESRIVLSAHGVVRGGDGATINVYNTSLLPFEECVSSESSVRKSWGINSRDLTIYQMGNDTLGIDMPFAHSTENSKSLSSVDFPLNEWFCLGYKFLTSLFTNNLCLDIAYSTNSISDLNVVWAKCFPLRDDEHFNTVCIPPNYGGSTKFGRIVRIRSFKEIGTGYSKVWRPRDIVSTILLTKPWSQKGPFNNCDVNEIDCGWHQSTSNSVIWSKDARLRRFLFTPLSNTDSQNKSDLFHSPIFEMNSTCAWISFTMKASMPVVVRLELKRFSANDIQNNWETVGLAENIVLAKSAKNVSEKFVISQGFFEIVLSVSPISGLQQLGKSDYLEDFKVLGECDSQQSNNCSTFCNWEKHAAYVIKNLTSFNNLLDDVKSKMAPPINSKFASDGSYLILFTSDEYGNYERFTVTGPSHIPSSAEYCVEFSYYMVGFDGDHDVTLNAYQKFTSGYSVKQLWSQDGSVGMGWVKVRLPIKTETPLSSKSDNYDPWVRNEEFSLNFNVNAGPEHVEKFFVAIDSIVIHDDWLCEEYADFVQPPVIL